MHVQVIMSVYIYIHVHVLQKELHENDSFLVVTIVKIKLCS